MTTLTRAAFPELLLMTGVVEDNVITVCVTIDPEPGTVSIHRPRRHNGRLPKRVAAHGISPVEQRTQWNHDHGQQGRMAQPMPTQQVPKWPGSSRVAHRAYSFLGLRRKCRFKDIEPLREQHEP